MSITIEELEIEPLDRFGMYAFLDLVRVMEPHTEILMRERATSTHEEDEYDSPHSRPWFVSFHGSEFPGVEANACSRYLAYRMMNFPSTEAMPPWVTTTGVLGKAGELDIADAWHRGGRLLSIPEDPAKPKIKQLGFVDPDVWMTVSTDLPILPPGWHRPYIVEVKCKADEVIEEMLNGRLIQKPDGTLEKVGRGPDEKHVIQLKTTIGQAHDFDWGQVTVCSGCWRILGGDIFGKLTEQSNVNPAISPQTVAEDNLRHCPWCGHEGQTTFELEPPESGELYYWSRSWPRKTKSFYFEYDRAFMEAGKKVLAQTRAHYIADEIPPRPDHFQWSLGACLYCNFKPFCRLDSGLEPRKRRPNPKLVRTKLTESAGVDHARTLRPHYDPNAVRERVFKEWS